MVIGVIYYYNREWSYKIHRAEAGNNIVNYFYLYLLKLDLSGALG